MVVPSAMTSRAEILARLAAATPGPWWRSPVGATGGATVRTEDGNRPVARLDPGDRDVLNLAGEVGAERARRAIEQTQADAELIAHAPDDLRHLLHLVEQMERELRDEALGGGGSHWAECYRCHIDCATARIAQQRKAIDRFIKAGDELVKHLHYEGHWDALAAWDEAKGGAA